MGEARENGQRKEKNMDRVIRHLNRCYYSLSQDIERAKINKREAIREVEYLESGLEEIVETAQKYGVSLFLKEEWEKIIKEE